MMFKLIQVQINRQPFRDFAMEQQLRLDHPQTAFDLLSSDSVAKIDAAKLRARATLVSRLSEFWARTGPTPALLVALEPAELIPEFENYATALYEVMARELRPHFSKTEDFLLQLPVIQERVVKQIGPYRNRKRDLEPSNWPVIQHALNGPLFGTLIKIRVYPNEGTGDWETCIGESFASQFSRLHARIYGANRKASIEFKKYRVVAVCKFQQHLRTYVHQQEFDVRLRDHFSRWVEELKKRLTANQGIEIPLSPVPTQQGGQGIDFESLSSNLESATTERRARKGDVTLLQKSDGSFYESVEFPRAELYAGIGDRRRQQAIKEGLLTVVGRGKHRRITVGSLRSYCPPREDAK